MPKSERRASSRWQRWLLVALLVLSLYALALMLVQGNALGLAAQRLVSPTGLAAAGLCCLSYGLRGWRWRVWMQVMERPLPAWRALRFYVAGYAFTATPGNLGEAVRGMLPVQAPLGVVRSAAVFGAERLADLMGLCLLSLPVIAWLFKLLGDQLRSMPLTASGDSSVPVLMLVLGAALLLCALTAAALWWRRAAWWGTARSRLSRHRELLQSVWACLRHRPLAWASLTLLAWAAQGLAVWLLCRLADVPLDFVHASASYAAAMIGGAVSLLPAGLGGTEFLLAALLAAQGAGLADAIAVTVLVRLVTLWLAVLLGVVCLLYSTAVSRDLRLL